MAITPLPTPPSRDDPTNFATRADAFMAALPDFATETNAVATAVDADASAASSSASSAAAQVVLATAQVSLANTQRVLAETAASNASTSAGNASTSATAAAASAASAAALAGAFVGTSTTSLTIGLGTKTFATQSGEQYTSGIWISAVSAANGANYMFGQVTSYSGTSLVVDVQATGGSGTLADWNLSLAGVRGPAGVGITPQTVGFTLAGGTTSKTFTGDIDLTASDVVTKNTSQTLTNKTIEAADLTGATKFAGSSGTIGQVLTSAGNGNAPTWASAGGGAQGFITQFNGGNIPPTISNDSFALI